MKKNLGQGVTVYTIYKVYIRMWEGMNKDGHNII